MIYKGKEAKEKLLNGINKNVDVVKTTLGAKGRNVLIVGSYFNNVTKDGVSVSKAITLEDSVENAGSDMVKNGADKTLREAGDGTTTSSILIQSMCQSMFEQTNLGLDVNTLCRDLKEDLTTVKKYIKGKSIKVENTEQIKQLALVSANGDEEIADMIKNIYDEIGFEGSIDVRESDSLETTYETVKGYSLPNTGYISNLFVNNHEKGRVELNNPRVLIYNGNIDKPDIALVNLLEENHPSKNNTPLVLIVHDIEDFMLSNLIGALEAREIADVVIVKSNLIHKNRENRFLDACAFLGGKMGSDKLGEVGSCERIIIEKDNTTFINGKGDNKEYNKKVKKELSKKTDFESKDRLFRLESNGAVIHVGGKLQDEIGERKDRIDDAVLAVKSAIEEGFCAGGASTYLFANKELKLKSVVMKTALKSCYNQLMINAGKEPNYELRDITDKEYGYGYNVNTSQIENFLENGIIDSSKVLRVSLENSVHTACTFAMVEAVID